MIRWFALSVNRKPSGVASRQVVTPQTAASMTQVMESVVQHGSGHLARYRFTGRLTYVIRDVYGFPPSDQLLGTGPAMRYLQVNCGAPEHAGGAHWFPDSITVTVPFRHARRPRG